jgi:hypothetical protein
LPAHGQTPQLEAEEDNDRHAANER